MLCKQYALLATRPQAHQIDDRIVITAWMSTFIQSPYLRKIYSMLNLSLGDMFGVVEFIDDCTVGIVYQHWLITGKEHNNQKTPSIVVSFGNFEHNLLLFYFIIKPNYSLYEWNAENITISVGVAVKIVYGHIATAIVLICYSTAAYLRLANF